jgi:hypothetical protein
VKLQPKRGLLAVTISERGAPKVGASRTAGRMAGILVSTSLRARTAPVAAVMLGVITLGLGVASVVLDHLTHQPGTGWSAAAVFITAAGGGTRDRGGDAARCPPAG